MVLKITYNLALIGVCKFFSVFRLKACSAEYPPRLLSPFSFLLPSLSYLALGFILFWVVFKVWFIKIEFT